MELFPARVRVLTGLLVLLLTIRSAHAEKPDAIAKSMTPSPVFLSPARLAELRNRLAAGREPQVSAFAKVKSDADANLERQPSAPETWHVPGYYSDPKGHASAKQVLQDDANFTYALGLAYAMTGDEKYAVAAARHINGWSRLEKFDKKADGRLSFSYHFPAMIYGADLIRRSPSWKAEDQKRWGKFLRDGALPMNCQEVHNNWGNWGNVLVISIAAYLGDQALFDAAVARWKELIASQMDERGHLTHEVTRNNNTGGHGMWYSHFSLMPATIAAEIARVRGVDIFDYKATNGRSLELAYQPVIGWVADPATFPYFKPAKPEDKLVAVYYIGYFEILNNHWPTPAGAASLKAKRPLAATHSTPYLTFTHGDLPQP